MSSKYYVCKGLKRFYKCVKITIYTINFVLTNLLKNIKLYINAHFTWNTEIIFCYEICLNFRLILKVLMKECVYTGLVL